MRNQKVEKPSLKSVKAIGFDYFGTLVEAEAEVTDCLTSMCSHLHELGYSFKDDAFLNTYRNIVRQKRSTRYEGFKEVNNSVWVSDTLNSMGFETDSDHPEILSTVEKYFAEWQLTLYPDVIPVIKKLREDFKIGIVSNFTDSNFLNKTLRKFDIAGFFDSVTISDNCGWRKPHRNIFKEFLKSLDTRPSETVFVGDDPISDVKGGNDMGIATVLIKRTDKDPEDKPDVAPDFIVSSLTELQKLLST
jgi:2-haloalkanoic acid dehalogenase type II